MRPARTTWKYVVALVPAALIVLIVWAAALMPKPCAEPVTYRLGTIDPRFGLSAHDARQALDHAASIWNSVEGKVLLRYDESGLPVNFVYGDVQRARDAKQPLAASVERNQSVVDVLEHKIRDLQHAFDAEKRRFEADSDAFNRSQNAHNARVAYLNENGGGAAADYYLLNREQDRLERARAALELRLHEINGLSDRINALVNRHNWLVYEDNAHVAVINRDAGVMHVDGDYHVENGARAINIFEVADSASLVTLLAHELGHALGLGHNADPASIMAATGDDPAYAGRMSGAPKSPSAEDIASLNEVCRQ